MDGDRVSSSVRLLRTATTAGSCRDHVERANLTMRMGMRRFTRLTNGSSKEIEDHAAAVALHFQS